MPINGERRDCIVSLDCFVPTDASVLCLVDHDSEHRRRFDFPDDFIPSVRHSENIIARWEEGRRTGTCFPFAVRDATSGELVGGCELKPAGDRVASLSYWTHPAQRGRGVASEAVRLVCDLAFAQFGFRRVEVVTDADNVFSRRVAIRNGFDERGIRDGRVLYVRETGE